MATPAERLASTQATLDSIAGGVVDPAAMVTLIDLAIADAVSSGIPVVSYSINGRSATMSLSEARALREYYDQLVKDAASNGGFIPQGSEFV